MSLDSDLWWAVARSEEVTSQKPLSVDIGDQPDVAVGCVRWACGARVRDIHAEIVIPPGWPHHVLVPMLPGCILSEQDPSARGFGNSNCVIWDQQSATEPVRIGTVITILNAFLRPHAGEFQPWCDPK